MELSTLVSDLAAGDRAAVRRLEQFVDAWLEAASIVDAVWLRHRWGAAPWASHQRRVEIAPASPSDVRKMVSAAEFLDEVEARR